MAPTAEQLEQLANASNRALEGVSVEELALEAEEALTDADDARSGQMVNVPNATDPMAMMIDEATSAGKVVVYDIRNGEPSVVNRNLLQNQLTKKDPATGLRVFTTRRSEVPNIDHGTLLCLLHKDHADREYHKTLGLGTCKKSNLRTQLDVRNHTQRRHAQEWASIAEDKEQARVADESRRNELTLKALERQLAEPVAPATAVTQPVEQPEAPEVATKEWTTASGTCPSCDWTNSAPKSGSRKVAYYKHKGIHE